MNKRCCNLESCLDCQHTLHALKFPASGSCGAACSATMWHCAFPTLLIQLIKVCSLAQNVRKGNFPVVADNHTLILNWNAYTLPLLRQISVSRQERAHVPGTDGCAPEPSCLASFFYEPDPVRIAFIQVHGAQSVPCISALARCRFTLQSTLQTLRLLIGCFKASGLATIQSTPATFSASPAEETMLLAPKMSKCLLLHTHAWPG